MTKAEAIAMLKRIQEPEAWEPQINQAAFEALDMAIEALSQESSEDVISRQAAIDALDALCDRECEYSKQQRSVMCGACRLGSAFDVIDELPSAQPEVRTEMSSANDTISRQAVNDMLKELTKKASGRATLFNSAYAYYRGAISDVYYGVKGLPSAQTEHTETHSCDYQRTETHEWIPVSEALPEDGVTVWVTIRGHDVIRCEDGETLEQAIARISKIRWVTHGYWSEEEHGWNDPSFGCPLMVQPIAWMPINTPEPWRGQDE